VYMCVSMRSKIIVTVHRQNIHCLLIQYQSYLLLLALFQRLLHLYWVAVPDLDVYSKECEAYCTCQDTNLSISAVTENHVRAFHSKKKPQFWIVPNLFCGLS